jgi:hypothetical protein
VAKNLAFLLIPFYESLIIISASATVAQLKMLVAIDNVIMLSGLIVTAIDQHQIPLARS